MYEKNYIDELFDAGTIFTISFFWDRPERDTFILAESHDDENVFKIVCISGYSAGTQSGYIKKGVLKETRRAITYTELIEGIKYNILSPDLNSLKIEDGCKIKFGRSLKINCDKIFYRGTIFTISYLNGSQRRDSFILAECFEKKYVVQIICISGPFSGMIFGYIEKGILQKTHDAITFEELVDGIKKNLINPELESLKIRDEYNVRFD
ncbi:MAG: hypothetical protein IKJ67_09650 [Bacteroidales bacterium]|nr:hypothetical protein [Bacteroidales bacterium]